MNLHKSRTATFDLINEPENANALSKTHDFVCIQEPWTDRVGNARKGSRWHIIYPTSRLSMESGVLLRSIILINRKISSNVWRQIDVPGTNDITAILLTGPFGKLGIFNIYNDGKHSITLTILKHAM
ncbi:hypothetical protein F5879DRAFT_910338, partial [Lentinula edodes]|uniref:uncharacterized protein n=1 Tax=Lentinula edodes TaxID=5353 RepID=UPI001E8D50BD